MDKFVNGLRIVPVVAGVLVGTSLIVFYLYHTSNFDKSSIWVATGICAVTFAIVAILRFGVNGLSSGNSGATIIAPDDAATRQKIAPLIIGIGTSGIFATAVVVILAVRAHDVDGKFIMGIFSSVVPVFSTWVGAVIAFYFSNESFRIAAQASSSQVTTDDGDLLAGSVRAIPYDKITKIELPDTIETTAKATAENYDMAKIRVMFTKTVTRIILFDAKRRAICIIRSSLDDTSARTVSDYYKLKQNATDAKNFQMLPSSATVGDAKRALQLFKTLNVFITDHGAVDDPVAAWVPDDKLQ